MPCGFCACFAAKAVVSCLYTLPQSLRLALVGKIADELQGLAVVCKVMTHHHLQIASMALKHKVHAVSAILVEDRQTRKPATCVRA